MAEAHMVSALRDKRAELSGVIADLEQRIAQHRADLVRVGAVLRLFAPERSRCFADGELTRRCLDALCVGDGQPVAAEAIAIAAMGDKGLDPADRKTRSDFIRRNLYALTALRTKGWSPNSATGWAPAGAWPSRRRDHATWARCQ